MAVGLTLVRENQLTKCIRCESSSFAFTVNGVLCETCGGIVPPSDVQAYLNLIEPEDEIVIGYMVYEEPVSISSDLDEFDLRHGIGW